MTISSSEVLAGSLAQAVDRAFGLACAFFDRGEGIGYRHAQIVVAMDADDGVSTVGYLGDDLRDHLPEFFGHGIADRVGDIDRRGPGLDGRRDDLVEVVRLSASGVQG